MLGKFFLRLIANGLAFMLADYLLTKVDLAGNWLVLVIAVLVFSFVNTFVKPVVTLLSLPAIIFSFGLFYLIVNGLMVWLVSAIVPGFEVAGLWTAVAMGLIITLVNWIFHLIFDWEDKKVESRQ